MGRLMSFLSDENNSYSLASMTDESPFQSLNSIKSGKINLPAWIPLREETLMEGQSITNSSHKKSKEVFL